MSNSFLTSIGGGGYSQGRHKVEEGRNLGDLTCEMQGMGWRLCCCCCAFGI